MARVVLDTGVLIAAVRGRIDLGALSDNDDLALPAVAVAEYLTGTLLDADPGRARAQRAFLDEILRLVPVYDYDLLIAEHHAALLAHVRRTGEKRGAHDLLVAATARATDRTVLTTDVRARFDELPGVTAQLVSG